MTYILHRLRCLAATIAALALALPAIPTAALAGGSPVIGGAPVFYPPIIRVQDSDGNSGRGGGADNAGPDRPGSASRAGRAIARSLAASHRFCTSVSDTAYVIDCLAYEYWEIQKMLPEYGDYSEVKAVLRDTSRKLSQLAESNRSRTKRPGRIARAGPNPKSTRRAISPVDETRLPALTREAAVIINDGAALLLRTTGDSHRLAAQYQRIATSMRTGATLVRAL